MSHDLHTALNWLNLATQVVTYTRLNAFLGLKDLEIKEGWSTEGLGTDHGMVMILVSCPELKYVFKIHYNPQSLIHWASPTFGGRPEDLKLGQLSDFVKEMANLGAGAIKHEFDLHGIDVGTSLPLLSRGFDEIFFPPADDKRVFISRWSVMSSTGGIRCSTHLELEDEKIFDRMKIGHILSDNQYSGEVEVL